MTATLNSWQTKATQKFWVRKPHNVSACLAKGHPRFGGRLSIFELPSPPGQRSQFPPLRRFCSKPPRSAAAITPVSEPAVINPKLLRFGIVTFPTAGTRSCQVPARQTLAPVVVFAAALALSHPPDVAIGLALAAHMATSGQHVSLVVVPRYLEADPQLENLLQGQSQTITGGIVLGQTPTVPDDTSALLRQLLTSPDPLSRVTTMLTENGGLAVGLLGLLGLLAVAPQIGGLAVLMIERREERRDHKEPKPEPDGEPKLGSGVTERNDSLSTESTGSGSRPSSAVPSDWASELNGQRVTVWLRSGRMVTGDAKGLQNAAVVQGTEPVLTVLRLEEATVAPKNDAPPEPGSVLIPIAGIDVIAIGVREPSP